MIRMNRITFIEMTGMAGVTRITVMTRMSGSNFARPTLFVV